ncbi:cation:proton antiporter [Neolewinella lacunae]|uniref:Cation:proton antiporter n=1 Tax=Neolewinella lacunae TaxID=1517758 RepID=A0A923PPT3_9BACT|nr:cation:proton antiporter [Neolewinella lacunae]MBC6994492.1 cation:proton antiporter [Neolewinella lacunae]MDN3634185.1 cation:proton antiporter [Neolewinella lacunae]
MTTHILLLLLAGLALLSTFLLPGLLRDRLLPLPILYVGAGYLLFKLPLELPLMNPEDARVDRQVMEYITEFIVIISLAGTGLKMKRAPGWKSWSTGIYLLAIAMPLTIGAVALLGWWWIGLAPASAILLGAVLAPTDPVLAGNVQVGPPDDDSSEDEVRFGLTLEAGLNDGLAFPFVYLALALVATTNLSESLVTWAWWDFGYRIAVGTLAGWGLGKSLGWLFRAYEKRVAGMDKNEVKEGIFILAATLITYAVTEMLEGYGFLAVFVAAVVSATRTQANTASRQRSYEAIDQVEQAVLGIFLIAFGGIIATGGLADLTWPGTLLGLALLLLLRPLAGLISFLPSRLPLVDKLAISYFGIRGVGSLYYLAYAHNSNQFPEIDAVWSIVNFTMLASIIIHGFSVKPVLDWVDRRMGRVEEGAAAGDSPGGFRDAREGTK